ncbi:SMI1/KNR4 family protein [Prosthecobacter sp. SYSU 5D2]|uniref:SMI1/KNR4 family protein n=1 Tax=Prosthecobacter sp. SYSU 5D2 TaxID=3134134 RepID=UPI0031FE8682
MTEEDIAKIETALGVCLPADYRAHLAKNDEDEEEHGVVDDVTAMRDAYGIIKATRDYRAGFEGLPPWPAHWVYMGDEADACPYAVDCVSGQFRKTDKGNLLRPPLKAYASFDEFHAEHLRAYDERMYVSDEPLTLGDRVKNWLWGLAIFLGIFVVMPMILFSLKLLYRYLVYGEVPRFENKW